MQTLWNKGFTNKIIMWATKYYVDTYNILAQKLYSHFHTPIKVQGI